MSRPGSLYRQSGHILIRTPFVEWDGALGCHTFTPYFSIRLNIPDNRSIHHLVVYEQIRYRFVNSGGYIYYVNGRGDVYETDLESAFGISFVPEMLNLAGDPVMFEKVSRLELLFGNDR